MHLYRPHFIKFPEIQKFCRQWNFNEFVFVKQINLRENISVKDTRVCLHAAAFYIACCIINGCITGIHLCMHGLTHGGLGPDINLLTYIIMMDTCYT